MANSSPIGRREPAPVKLVFATWSKAFLNELAATSNVSAAARHAGIATSSAYEARRANPEFSRRWQQALCEGYDLSVVTTFGTLCGLD